jgi:hypothetical protein
MLTGPTVSSLQGAPRSTHDINIVVELSWGDFNALLEEFSPPAYETNEAAARDAMIADRNDALFSTMDAESGYKIDFWILSEDAFDLSRFSRKRVIQWQGISIVVSSPEDTILQKLRWAKKSGGSERQIEDARAVYSIQGDALDMNYLDRWAQRLGVQSELEHIRSS